MIYLYNVLINDISINYILHTMVMLILKLSSWPNAEVTIDDHLLACLDKVVSL